MSQTIYKSSGAFPALQSITETKHRSGLLAVSAEYISTGQGAPQSIQTSMGPVPVFPAPSLSKDTSGFVKINATGYGVWSQSQYDEVFNISVYDMPCYYFYQRGPSSQGFTPEGNTIRIPVIIESGWVKKINSGPNPVIPSLSRPLEIIEPATFSVTIPYDGRIVTGTPVLNQSRSMVKRNYYGAVIETEAAYEIRPYIDLGTFEFGVP